ncbi:MAG: phage holin family protein [Chloroflexota bacterium]|nr:phage holin family protein [Chloroflexota bacterium]PLS82946.1 MAG: phage holin family protein [Chloroflexota bacterium]
MQERRDDRSLGELIAELSRDMTALVRQEVEIARTEIVQKAFQAGKDVGFVAAGGAIAYAGLLAIIASMIIILRKAGLPWWLSALVMGSMIAGLGSFLIFKGLNELKQADLVPRQTIETLKEDKEWAKAQMT